MAYSISVSIKSQRLKGEMYDFLREMYRPWPEVVDEGGPSRFSTPRTELAHARGRCILGFDYNAVVGSEREYNFALTRWVAIKVGRRKSRFRSENLMLSIPVPYYVYDGLEAWPILIDDEWGLIPDELGWCLHDRLGMCQTDIVARELAWHHIPKRVHETITMTHRGKTADEIKEAFIQAGLPGARDTLRRIRAQLDRLDVFWRDVAA